LSTPLKPRRIGTNWILEIPPEMAALLKVDPASIVLLYPKEGRLETDILSPPSNEMKANFEKLLVKHSNTFEKLKQIDQ